MKLEERREMVSEESKGIKVYWTDTKSVAVKQNIYYDNTSACCYSEGEQNIEIVKMKVDKPPSTILNTSVAPTTVPDNPEQAKHV